ncbi:hypothetical protein LWI28_016882 [Acer negundo]|uniref:Uncharacterized protein n=1 Tax=Acer negundo TaxID=4023 RepID=A0AAD5JAL4_ACENE|nr:hypothetical protein LWI28_016882 [Acer negundo]
MSCDKYAQSSENEKSLQSLRLSELMHEGSNVCSIASLSDHGTKIVKGKLAEALRLVEQDMKTINLLESLKIVNVQPVDDILNTTPILNPPIAKTKGLTNTRLKSNLEKRKRKTTKVYIHEDLKTQLKDMADNVSVDVEVEGEDSSTTSNVVWSLLMSLHDSDMTKVEFVLCARENKMKNEIGRLKNEWKDLVREVSRWRKKYRQLEGQISILEALVVELTIGQPVVGVKTACNGQISSDTS